MKPSFRCVLAGVLGVALAVIPATAEEPEPERVVLEVHQVIPEHAAAYETAIKEFLPMLAENGYTGYWYAFVTEEMQYMYGSPVKDFTGIQEQWDGWAEFAEKVGMDTLQPHFDKFTGTYEYSESSLWRHRPDLSYSSDPPKFDAEKDMFRSWGFVFVKPGMEMKFEESFKKFGSYSKEKGIEWAWDTWVAEFGGEMPVYVYSEVGPSRGEFWTESDKLEKEIGKDTMKIWVEMLPTVRRVEFIRGEYRPDLSYLPPAEEPAAEE
jgi:hypothetical protein